jgi:hypothetical protein
MRWKFPARADFRHIGLFWGSFIYTPTTLSVGAADSAHEEHIPQPRFALPALDLLEI